MKKFLTNKFWFVFGGIFTSIGVVFLFGSGFMHLDHKNFMATAVLVDGEVIELVPVSSDNGTTYKPVISFDTTTGESVQFVASFSSNPPRYSVGESVAIAYQADAPNDARVAAGSRLLVYVFGGVGVLQTLIGIAAIMYGLRKRAQRKRLLRSGRRVAATVTGVGRNTRITINGQHPFMITAQYHDPSTNTMYTYESDSVWFDPSAHVGETIEVLVDPSQYSIYYIDLSFLPGAQ